VNRRAPAVKIPLVTLAMLAMLALITVTAALCAASARTGSSPVRVPACGTEFYPSGPGTAQPCAITGSRTELEETP